MIDDTIIEYNKGVSNQSEINVIALSNVSIELGDRGLVFYIGCIWKRKNDAVTTANFGLLIKVKL